MDNSNGPSKTSFYVDEISVYNVILAGNLLFRMGVIIYNH